MNTIVILVAIAVFNGQPSIKVARFADVKSCQAALVQLHDSAIIAGATDGSFSCTEYPVNKLS